MESGTRTAVKIVTMLFEGPPEAVPELGCVVGLGAEGSAVGAVANDDSDDVGGDTEVNVPDVKLCNVEFASEIWAYSR